MLLPPQSRLNKRSLLPESVASAFFNPLVVVTVMTTLALILGVLSLASDPPSRKILAVCAIIGVFGLLAVIYEIRRLYLLDIARRFISALLAEGSQLTLFVEHHGERSEKTQGLIADWCQRVESVLREYLDESYVARFHLGGSLVQDANSMLVWKNKHRLETLASFLAELK
jgi:hypothetical protein